MSTTLSKFQGTLVGAVVGDCIGAIFENLWAKTINPNKVIGAIENLETVSKEEDNHRIYEFTDDTAMARSVAKSLVINEGFDASDMAERFSENYFDEPDRGYGGNVINVFSQLKELDYKDVFGPAKKQFGGSGSYGNGGAMRIAPAALFTFKDDDPEKSKDLVTQITSITHSNNQAILGAVLQSYAVDMALNSSSSFSPDEMVDALITLMKMVEEEPKETNQSSEGPQKEDKSEQKLKTYVEKLELIKTYLKQEEQPTQLTVHTELGADISAFESVPAAVYSFLRSQKDFADLKDRNSFEKTIVYAISLGGDSDTVATMAGAIAGACYGVESIPISWQKCCEGVEDAKKFAEGLYKLSQMS